MTRPIIKAYAAETTQGLIVCKAHSKDNAKKALIKWAKDYLDEVVVPSDIREISPVLHSGAPAIDRVRQVSQGSQFWWEIIPIGLDKSKPQMVPQ